MNKYVNIIILAVIMMFVPACTRTLGLDTQPGVSTDTPTKGFPTPSISSNPTAAITSTQLPKATPTISPFYDIQDISDWPQEMQDYFMRLPEEWDQPNHQYPSDTEFQEFVTSARRDFLTKHLSTDLSPFTDHEVLLTYIKWGNQNKQIIILTPLEIRGMLTDKENADPSYSIIIDNSLTFHEGVFTLQHLRTDVDFESLLNQLAELSFSIKVFGEQMVIPRTGYYGFAGDEAALFLIPGIKPEEGIGILGHWNPAPDKHAWLPMVVHFIPYVFSAGDIGIFNADIVTYETETMMGPAHTGPRGNEGPLVTLNDLLKNIGQKIQASADYAWIGDFNGNFPWQLGIEGAQRLEFERSPLIFPPIIYPWD